ncbi:Hint domain-containing protein [Pseudoalteromonas denitrificans]|uniref:Intein N-terminal splicing region n=1 Tax=Pseudoalteromonas denitrificans DSM 6059 TaxID=1123010 RepID=A0A1I1UMJ7_9GAMM|nr:Hint domain-containing protein [Pseudoalteromonas denitrificans]SFD72016.1 intein N-terminal splicing region [Pseudoalteromonas denitrificans DSM 6059]
MKSLKVVLLSLVCFFSTNTFAAPMDQAQFEILGNKDKSRCVGGRSPAYCKGELDYALSKNLITNRSYTWGLENGYYPVVTRNDLVDAICKCGCFEANTDISVWLKELGTKGTVAAKDIEKHDRLVGLTSDATLSTLTTQNFGLKSITSGAEKLELYVFNLENGTQLKVTQHHGMLLSSGEMIAAKDVTASDSFISAATQNEVEIVNITREVTYDDVYNFETNGSDDANHIIVAEGIYVGDIVWQNQLASELGKIAIRR